MPKLRSLPSLVRAVDIRTIRPPAKIKDPIYNSPQFQAWRTQVIARAGGRCEYVDNQGDRCPKARPAHRMYADHIVELKDGGSLLNPANGQCLCASHHELKTAAVRRQRTEWSGSLSKPNLPRPNCKVKLICGPPAAGKSTYIRTYAGPNDIIIDLDMIARQHGLGRHRPDAAPTLLRERNQRLAALAHEPIDRVAWVIVGAPSKQLREWWCSMLGVLPNDLIVLVPTRTELRRRVLNDPDRDNVIDLHLSLIDRWFAREIGVAAIYDQSDGFDGG
jgi:5-methylcytosine-specific restriction enzyme A